MVKYISIAIILFSTLLAQNLEHHNTLETFLQSSASNKSYISYMKITENPNNYQDLILDEFKSFSKTPEKTPNSLIYLSTVIKDKRYIPYLKNLIENKEYAYTKCVYDCPIVFALTCYSLFSEHQIPELNKSLTPVLDFYSEIEFVEKLELKTENASKYISGPGIDSEIKKSEKLTIEELIDLASPKNNKSLSRVAASYILSFRLIDPKYLRNLYWLAISEQEDASSQFRSSIYQTIYRSEKLKLKSN